MGPVCLLSHHHHHHSEATSPITLLEVVIIGKISVKGENLIENVGNEKIRGIE